MDKEEREPTVPAGTDAVRKGRRVGRRTAIKGGVAAAAGLALGASYARPSVMSVGVQEAYAASPVVTPTPTPDPVMGCSPGYWGRSPLGREIWDDPVLDPDWQTAFGNTNQPYYHLTLFSSFFSTGPLTPNIKSTTTMIALVEGGGGSQPDWKAARSLVAAYLNACTAHGYHYTTAQLLQMWSDAVAAGGNAFLTLYSDLDYWNNGYCPS